MGSIICKNCGSEVAGKYCGHCGQKSSVSRINLSSFSNDISESVFQVHKGLFYTLKCLFVKPGNTLKEYLGGKRKNHMKPIAYVLTLSTLFYLVTQLTGQETWMGDLITGFSGRASDEDSILEVPATITWFSKNYAYATLILLPVFSFASYLSFYDFKVNYLEHIVINSYVTGQQALFYILFAFFKLFFNLEVLELLPFLLSAMYGYWVFYQFFSQGSRMINILRFTLANILYLLFTMGLFMLSVAIEVFV